MNGILVSGMKCAGGVKAVERQLTKQTGVISALVNQATARANVECETKIRTYVKALVVV